MSQEPPKLSGHHEDTLRQIFAHPLSHNVEWHAVLALLRELGPVEERNGLVKVKVGSEALTLTRSHGKDLDGDNVVAVRRFLESLGFRAGRAP